MDKIPKEMHSAVLEAEAKVGFCRVPVQPVKKGMVLIKVEAAPLNPSDLLFMKGYYNIKLDFPYTPGWEGSGTVVAAGEGTYPQMLLGKRVSFMKASELRHYKYGGAYAEYCTTHAINCMPFGDDTTFEEASTYFVNPLTAIGMVKRL